MVAKIDDEGLCFSIIKTYCYFSFVFFCAKKGRVVEKTKSDAATLKILR